MSNLTLSIDDDLIKQARVRAIHQGTSLSAKVREFLQQYVNTPDTDLQNQREIDTQRLLAAMEVVTQASRPLPPKVPGQTLRDELYEGDFRARDRQG